MVKAIFIDAGHGLGPTGAIDNGAAGNGTTERKEVVEIAQKLFARLSADPAFAGVAIITIAVDSRMMLKDHIAEVNQRCREQGWGATDALLVSIHINSAGAPAARGVEAWYSPEEGTIDFAKALVEQVSAATGLPARPSPALATAQNRYGRLGIIDDTIPRGCLVECGFISNEFDAAVLKDAAMDDLFAQGIERAIRSFLGLPLTSVPPPAAGELRDVPVLAWYAGDVKLCIHEELFNAPIDGYFHPERPVTRAELAAVLARHLHRHHGVS